ncbi:hypothetical protein AQI88_21860 [Streptomyces cellostaticus]|uniref:Uncharacterized protein n=1 Tax=Streptomyces cellostaticus TaxID=67285 RepID=A0A117PVX8_9ACTN|nr:hypothetical protein AQI88_21860 [Streptomyces cellostaticus]
MIAAGFLALGVYLGLVAVGRLGLIGHPLTMRAATCYANVPATTSRGGDSHPMLSCMGPVDGGRWITATGFSSRPRPDASVEVAQDPWGSWVPVDQGGWKLGRALSPLIPLAFAWVFAKWTLMNYRGWRNSSRLPTGSSE